MDAVVPNKEGDMEYLLHRIKCLQLEDTIVDATFRNYDHLCQITYSEMFPELGCPLNEQVMQRISKLVGDRIRLRYDALDCQVNSTTIMGGHHELAAG